MKQILTKELFGKDADFFINGNNPKIVKVTPLDREGRSAIEITIEVDHYFTPNPTKVEN